MILGVETADLSLAGLILNVHHRLACVEVRPGRILHYGGARLRRVGFVTILLDAYQLWILEPGTRILTIRCCLQE